MAKIRANMANLTMHGEAEQFIETYRFPQELVEHVCKYPQEVTLDPTSADKGYHVLRMRRGDITVVVGLRDPENPLALYVYLNTPEDHTYGGGTRKSTPGAGTKKEKAPQSLRQMLGWCAANGCTTEWSSGSGHTKVYFEGAFMGTLPTTPSDHRSFKNAYSQISKKVAVARARQSITEDMEKTHG